MTLCVSYLEMGGIVNPPNQRVLPNTHAGEFDLMGDGRLEDDGSFRGLEGDAVLRLAGDFAMVFFLDIFLGGMVTDY